MKIPFNKPYLTGKEMHYMYQAVQAGRISGNGIFTNKCQEFFVQKYGYGKPLLTTSCTDALEMAAILLDISEGDEVIIPAFTFVSSANAFVLRGAVIKFADSLKSHPNIDPDEIVRLISPKTKAIVVVHYAGVACDMDSIMNISNEFGIPVVEDAAQAIDSYHSEKPLGSFGKLSCFSFHETKNIISGEGGMLIVNDPELEERAEIIWEKGTNRAAMQRGEVQKYGWVDIGSSFLPSDIIAAFLYAQLEDLDKIQSRRVKLWSRYYDAFSELEKKGALTRPFLPTYATNNAHMFYLICESEETRNGLIDHLQEKGILAVFHYLSLNQSPYFKSNFQVESLSNSEAYETLLLRLPLYYSLTDSEQTRVIDAVIEFFRTH